MQAILSIDPNEMDNSLKEFDMACPLDYLIDKFTKAGYSEGFIKDLKTGFETSEIYSG